MVSNSSGTIYLVATPIGNLEDMSPRAARILAEVDLIAAEDTRHSAVLLKHLGVRTPMIAFHEHNEADKTPTLVEQAGNGKNLALISDAGTPLVSDPGFRLVRAAHRAGIRVSAVPGPCAAITALIVSGLPTDRFSFRGFPPAKSGARRRLFEHDRAITETLIYYESPHRVVASLKDMCEVFGQSRQAVVARELTKKFETVLTGTLAELLVQVTDDEMQQKGEFVVLVEGRRAGTAGLGPEARHMVLRLAEELPPKKASALAAEFTGLKKNELYDFLLSDKRNGPG